jgi:hypothetical protein
MDGLPIGSMIDFSGGLPLSERHAINLGGLGMSADAADTDHRMAWHVWHALNLHTVPVGVVLNRTDCMRLDCQDDIRVSGFGHCTDNSRKPSDLAVAERSAYFPTRPNQSAGSTSPIVSRPWKPPIPAIIRTIQNRRHSGAFRRDWELSP